MQFYSQIGQDEWVYSMFPNKTDGYFVELGADDGVSLSNTLFFEKERNWKGICIEPNEFSYQKLVQNRKCHISHELIHSENDKVVNFEYMDMLSGIVDYSPKYKTAGASVVQKSTKTLAYVLDQFQAPNVIDYLSLDVEGHEYDILSTFPFDRYQFKCMTVEHNAPMFGSDARNKIRKLLTEKGYTFVKGNEDVQKPILPH